MDHNSDDSNDSGDSSDVMIRNDNGYFTDTADKET